MNYLQRKHMALMRAANSVKQYGVRWDGTSSTVCTRLGNAAGLVANAHKGSTDDVRNDFDNIYPWSKMRLCNIDERGNVLAYIGDEAFKRDGTNGDVMVEMPKFYYKRKKDGTAEEWWICEKQLPGYQLHPLFIDNGEEVDAVYHSAYNASTYTDDGKTKLQSITGARPAVRLMRENFRTYARNKGNTSWGMEDLSCVSALQMLYLIEYANTNSQAMLGSGVCNLAYSTHHKALEETINGNTITISSTYKNIYKLGQRIEIRTSQGVNNKSITPRSVTAVTTDEEAGQTTVTFDGEPINIAVDDLMWNVSPLNGSCDALNGKSGWLPGEYNYSNGYSDVNYRGIEGIYAKSYRFIDGVNIKDRVTYVSNSMADYANGIYDGKYKAVGYTNAEANGYVTALGYDETAPWVMLPSATGGSSVTYIPDNYYQGTGERVLLYGGSLSGGTACGMFFYTGNNTFGTTNPFYGAHLMLKKRRVNTATGYPLTLTDSAGKDIISLSIQGNAKQDDTVALDNPCDVYGVGDKTVNLFNWENYIEVNGLGVSYENGIIHLVNTRATTISYDVNVSLPSGVYTFYNTSSTNSSYYYVNDGGANTVNSNNIKNITLTQEENIVKIRFFVSANSVLDIPHLQIVEGAYTVDTMPDYEPYGYKIPVEVTGKNLFPKDEFKDIVLANVSRATVKTVDGRECISASSGYMNNITGTGPSELKYLFENGIKANTRYTLAFSIKNTAVSSLLWVCIYHTDGTWAYSPQTTVANGEWHTFIVTSATGKTVSGIGFTYGNGGTRVYDYSTAMLVEGVYTADTMPDYEPYFADVTNILPIDTPLYGVEKYNDELSLDFSRKKAALTRRVQKMVIDGNTTLSDEYFPLVLIRLSDDKYIVKNTKAICSHVPYDLGYVGAGNTAGSTFAIRNVDTYFGCSTIDDFKAWLTQNPLTVYYALQTPVVEDVSDKIQWDNIPTPTGTVNIQALTYVQPQGMTVKYFVQ